SAQLALQVAAQEEASEALKNFLGKFGTLRMVDGGDCTPDALFGKLNSVVVAMIQETPARDETFRDDSTGHSSDSNVGRPNTSPMDDTLVAPGAEAAIATTTEHVNDAASSMGIVDESVGSPLGHTAGRQPEEAAEVLSLSHDGAVATAQEGVVAAENESSGGLVPVERLMVAIARHWRLAEVQFE
ncbi:unnamed protein product, partial [Sphacelaria rigidula]